MNFIKTAFRKVKSKVAAAKLAVAAGVAAVTGSLMTTKPAQAAIDLTGVTVDTSDYIAIATFLITALVAFWGIRKGIGLLGR